MEQRFIIIIAALSALAVSGNALARDDAGDKQLDDRCPRHDQQQDDQDLPATEHI